MSRTEILSEIRKAEADANATVSEAEASRKAAVAEARRESVKKIQDAEAQMRSSYESAIAKENEHLEKQRAEILAVGKDEAVNLSARAAANMQEAKKYLIEQLERILNVTS